MSVSGIGQRQRRPDAAGGADGAEQIGVVIALVGGLPGRVPRLGHCRTWPFFWPMRASSSNQISIGVVSSRASR